MANQLQGRRVKVRASITDDSSANAALARAREGFQTGKYLEGIDLFEQLIELAPDQATPLLAELYDYYMKMPHRGNRFTLYVEREFDFQIKPGDKVLDIGSGHDPFPYATHLADFAPDDDSFGRAGIPMKRPDDKPFFECSVEDMPFEDNEFEFVYCSHVLEHTLEPMRACEELMRVARRGYIETPTPGKDLWMNTAGISNHHWKVENLSGRLIFTRYSEEEKKCIGTNLLMDMHCAPQTEREKAFSALVWLKSSLVNTSLYWEDRFDYEVRSLGI